VAAVQGGAMATPTAEDKEGWTLAAPDQESQGSVEPAPAASLD